ncbi:MAG: hypothetical protein JOY90_08155 [Bradyrhizobium sp.]|uniref:CBS domain-containing protein n=1 Tax=Bradyrhizobium sp. TaxID=376 RepID=UPI001DB337A7|nr:CBS domain-containing protein [Bradyrhizobium sp.]MBV9560417.1 hypothetical protein [Bradyrhizobium sp.]
MWTWKETATAIVAVAVLVGAVALRSLSAEKVQVTLPDALIAVIAAGLTLFLVGGIDKLIVGNGGITVEKAIVSAAKQPVNPQVTPLPVAPLEEALKGGTSEIPDFVRRQVQALEFVLGAGSYDPNAIQQYLQTLSKYPFLRFVVFLNTDRKFFGMMEAKKLLALLESPGGGQTFASLTALVNRGSPDDQQQLAKLAGFVPASGAVKSDANKREVLEQMETKNTDWLPVIKPNGQFQGVVDRSRLIASLILDVTDRVEAATPKP